MKRTRPIYVIVFVILSTLLGPASDALWGLDIVLERVFQGFEYDLNIYWVSPDTLAITNYDKPYMLIFNIEQNRGKMVTVEDVPDKTQCHYEILDADLDAQKLILQVYYEKERLKDIYQYYLYDVATGRITNLETEAEAIRANPEAYFKDFRYYFASEEKPISKNAYKYVLYRYDRYTGKKDIPYDSDESYPFDILQYDKEQGLIFAKDYLGGRFYIIPYDGNTLGTPQNIGYESGGNAALLLGRYIVGAGESVEEDFAKVVIRKINSNQIVKKIPQLETNFGYSQRVFAVNPRKNLLAILGLNYNQLQYPDFPDCISIYRYIPEAEINDDRVRFRSGPSTSAEILGVFNKKDRVKIYERSEKPMTIGDQTSYWYKVKKSDGKEVWVFGAFLTFLD
jgi:hypothetical protein